MPKPAVGELTWTSEGPGARITLKGPRAAVLPALGLPHAGAGGRGEPRSRVASCRRWGSRLRTGTSTQRRTRRCSHGRRRARAPRWSRTCGRAGRSVHDLCGTFITVGLANGKTEA
jgi:hypothetical protein